jgi:hypothetical protein
MVPKTERQARWLASGIWSISIFGSITVLLVPAIFFWRPCTYLASYPYNARWSERLLYMTKAGSPFPMILRDLKLGRTILIKNEKNKNERRT